MTTAVKKKKTPSKSTRLKTESPQKKPRAKGKTAAAGAAPSESLAVTGRAPSGARSGPRPVIGKKIKSFEAPATSGLEFSLPDYLGQTLVLYFYPKDNTPGCTLEGQDFRRLVAQFKKAGAVIFGVSKDSVTTHENFKKKCDFPFELLSDKDEKICRLFDVMQMKKLYGREYLGLERSTFVIDRDGVLRYEWRKVKVDGHADEVLKAVKELA